MGLGWKRWTRERLSAADLQGYLQDQVVPVFTSSSQRDQVLGTSAIPEGMHCYVIETGRTLVRVGTGASGSWQIVGMMPGRRVQKTDTQTLSTVGAWLLLANWNAPGVEPLSGTGMFVASTPSRLFATATGRYRMHCGLNGATHLQVRLNSGGNNNAGSMIAADNNTGPQYLQAVADGFVMNLGDHVEAFVQRSTAVGDVGAVQGYSCFFSLQYLGRNA